MAHEYLDVDKAVVYDMLQTRLGDFERFMGYISRFLRERETP